MGLIYLLEEIFGKVVFRIGDYEFEGIRLFKYMDLPWKNNTEMNEYMNGLEKEDTPYSYKKFIYWDEQSHYQMMHVLFSRSHICLIAGPVLLVLSVIFIIINIEAGALISLIASIIIIVLSKVFKARAKKYCSSVQMSQEIFKSFDTWPTYDEEEQQND
ncbi:MAG: hypothetical protein ABR927_17345 [Bacteroidales bacterium]|jgi:hypothetical protein